MKQVLIKRGAAVVEEVPAPVVDQGTVLVQVDHSCISVGTELSGIQTSATPLWQRALRQPGKVRQVAEMVATQGFTTTKNVVQGKLAAGDPTGYSAAGTVIEVGDGVTDLEPGDRVACAGAQSAHHAEVIRVPRNLVVRLPDTLSFAHASTVTLGAIALQGVRRAQPTLGESFVVIGLGLIGQLTAQLLRANGCRVIATDLDAARIRLATSLGADVGVGPGEDDGGVAQVARLTDGHGADGVIVTAATPSDAVMSTAFRMSRKKGRVVLVGDVGLHLNRADFYQKELDFFISSSYGPGRYDRNYEERGLDYPLAYIRWTENRNMSEYLRLLADGSVRVDPLITTVYPVARAGEAYQALREPADKPMAILLEYPPASGAEPTRVVPSMYVRPARSGAVRIGLIGAGGFAKGMHLPNIRSLASDFQLHAVASHTGHNAMATAAQYGAKYGTTEYERILEDPDVDLVLITTRHNLHAQIVLAALKNGKHVMVEKPLALTQSELDAIRALYEGSSTSEMPLLLTGFNRRFSPYATRMAEIAANRSNPMILVYRMNAGYIPLDHWVHGPEGGGRNRGEACHIYDLFTYLTGSRVTKVTSQAIRPRTDHYAAGDNFVATVGFDDGSVATLTYTAMGSGAFPKEQMDVFVDGKVVTLDDYRSLTITGGGPKGISTAAPQKGQKEELIALARALRHGGDWPIPLWQQVQATEIALRVEEQLGTLS